MRTLYAILGALVVGLPAAVLVAAQGGGDDPAEGTDAGDVIDLTPTALAGAPAAPLPGDAVTFTALVENVGANDSGTFNVSFFVDGAQLGANRTVVDLSAGDNVDVSSDTWAAAVGEHHVLVAVDVHDDVDEANEENNTFEITITVLPDLTVDDIAWAPAAPIEGEAVTFTATVNNSGNAPANDFNVSFLVDGLPLGAKKNVAALAPGATLDVASDAWVAAAGDHDVRVVVDSDDDVDESDEQDNERVETVTVADAVIDLVLADITLVPEAPDEDDTVTFTATVRNDGNVASGPFDVTFAVDGAPLGAAKNVADLAPGASIDVASDAWDAVEGVHTIVAAADPADAVDELDEGNNARGEEFAVGDVDLPDLEIDNIDLTPQDPDAGDDVRFTASIENDGEENAGAFVVRFLVDGALVSDEAVAGLASGDSVDVTSDVWDAVAGAHQVTVIVDALEQVAERDEDDNTREEAFDVQGPAPPPPEPDDDGDDGEKITICHRPPGNPDNEHTITVGASAWGAHERHGDAQGACPAEDDDAGADDHQDAHAGGAPRRGHQRANEARDAHDDHGGDGEDEEDDD